MLDALAVIAALGFGYFLGAIIIVWVQSRRDNK